MQPTPVQLATARKARLFQNGKKPDPLELLAAQQQIDHAKLEARIRDVLASEYAISTAQRQHLAGLLLGSA